MDENDLKEQEIRTRYITPAILNAGWALSQVREEQYITAGQVHPPRRRHTWRAPHVAAPSTALASACFYHGRLSLSKSDLLELCLE